MKKLLSLSTALVLTVLLATPVFAAWHFEFNTPASLINSKSFNLEFVALSTNSDEGGETITVKAFQENGEADIQVGEKTTSSGGDSGYFPLTVATDGTYQYYMTATNSNADPTRISATKTVQVDTAAPSAPSYAGKTRSGNTYTLTFTAPNDGDVKEVRIYSSTSNTFTASTANQVGSVPIGPGETKTFTYTAGDSNERFHALQAFDQSGNFSALVGDPNILVSQGSTTGGSGVNVEGSVAGSGASTQAGGNGQGPGAGDGEGQNEDQTEGDVLGDSFAEKVRTNWPYVLMGLAAILLAYWALVLRQGAPYGSDKNKPQ